MDVLEDFPEFNLDLIPEEIDKSKIQNEYHNVAEQILQFDYSLITRFQKYTLWDASLIQENRIISSAFSRMKSYPIGVLSNNRDRNDGNKTLAYYDVRLRSKQVSPCFRELLKELVYEYDCTILHRIVIFDEQQKDTGIRVWGILQDNFFVVLLMDKYHLLVPNKDSITKLGLNGVYSCQECYRTKEEYIFEYNEKNKQRNRR